MNRLLLTLMMLVAGVAVADELNDANKLLLEKSYDKALPIYAKLADAGNPEAQFRLGEMYWYGDGTAVDLTEAARWLQRAAAAGHSGAKEELALLKAREGRAGDIAYWTSGYRGEDLTSGKFDCPPPAIPALSKTKAEIKAVSAGIGKWEACYNGFVDNLNAGMPASKRIPAELASLMTPRETEAARAHLDQVYANVIAQAQSAAAAILGKRDKWQNSTEKFVLAINQESAARNKGDEMLARAVQRKELENYLRIPPVTPPASVPPLAKR
jgi:uncharacterized protein